MAIPRRPSNSGMRPDLLATAAGMAVNSALSVIGDICGGEEYLRLQVSGKPGIRQYSKSSSAKAGSSAQLRAKLLISRLPEQILEQCATCPRLAGLWETGRASMFRMSTFIRTIVIV